MLFFILGGNNVYAAQDTIKNVGFTPGHIWISEEYPIEGKVTRIYSVLFNGSEYDVSGKIEFFDNETLIDSVSVSMSKGTRVQDIWVDWSPRAGNHTVSARITDALISQPGKLPDRVFPEYSRAQELSVRVDYDTDKDGIGNIQDVDDDNDGIVDVKENNRGTDPLSADTDKDSVMDGVDKNPTDSTVTLYDQESSVSSLSPFIQSTAGFIAGTSGHIIKKLEKFSRVGGMYIERHRENIMKNIEKDTVYHVISTDEKKSSSSFAGSLSKASPSHRRIGIFTQYAYAFLLSFLVVILKIKILFYLSFLIFGSYIFRKIFHVMNS